MSNTFRTSSKVVIDQGLMLEEGLLYPNLMTRSYEQQYSPGVGKTISVNIPPNRDGEFITDGSDATLENITENATVPITIRGHASVRVKLTPNDLRYNITDFNSQVGIPSIRALTKKVELECLKQMSALIPQNMTGTVGNEMSTLTDIINMEKQIYTTAQSERKKVAVLSPNSDGNLAAADVYINKDYRDNGQVVKALEGMKLAKTRTIELYRSYRQNTAFNRGNVAGTVLVDGAGQTGTILHIDGFTADGDTFSGTSFTISGDSQRYTMVEDTTVSGNEGDFVITPAITSAPADDAAITFESAFVQNYCWEPDAIACVILPTLPEGSGNNSYTYFNNGFGFTVIESPFSTANGSKEMLWQCDVGVRVLDPRRVCVGQGL